MVRVRLLNLLIKIAGCLLSREANNNMRMWTKVSRARAEPAVLPSKVYKTEAPTPTNVYRASFHSNMLTSANLAKKRKHRGRLCRQKKYFHPRQSNTRQRCLQMTIRKNSAYRTQQVQPFRRSVVHKEHSKMTVSNEHIVKKENHVNTYSYLVAHHHLCALGRVYT